MPEARYTAEQIESATANLFLKWTNYLRSQQALPRICIAVGQVGDKRSEPELVLCMPHDLPLDWVIEALQATLSVIEGEKARQGG